MLVYDLDGKQSNWQIKGKEVRLDTRPRSSLHKTARELIKSKHPTLMLLEEVPIKLHHIQTVYFDFYIPVMKTAVEVHGEQHYTFSSMFHGSVMDFMQQKRRDREKQEWCDINNINLIVLPFNEIDNWEKLL